MTRKDYQSLADALKATRPDFGTEAEKAQWDRDVSEIANALKHDNGRFDYSRFYSACGYE